MLLFEVVWCGGSLGFGAGVQHAAIVRVFSFLFIKKIKCFFCCLRWCGVVVVLVLELVFNMPRLCKYFCFFLSKKLSVFVVVWCGGSLGFGAGVQHAAIV